MMVRVLDEIGEELYEEIAVAPHLHVGRDLCPERTPTLLDRWV